MRISVITKPVDESNYDLIQEYYDGVVINFDDNTAGPVKNGLMIQWTVATQGITLLALNVYSNTAAAYFIEDSEKSDEVEIKDINFNDIQERAKSAVLYKNMDLDPYDGLSVKSITFYEGHDTINIMLEEEEE